MLTQFASQLDANTNMECRNDSSHIIKVCNFQALVNDQYSLKSTV